jgi:hypothetical protein
MTLPLPTVAVCSICNQPIRLEACKSDENGKPVHEECYLQRLMGSLNDPPSAQHTE